MRGRDSAFLMATGLGGVMRMLGRSEKIFGRPSGSLPGNCAGFGADFDRNGIFVFIASNLAANREFIAEGNLLLAPSTPDSSPSSLW